MYKFKDIYTIDFSKVEYYTEIHAIIKKALDFPDYYGGNWSAFWDCLTDMYGDPIHIEINDMNIESDKVGHHGLFMKASYGDTVLCYTSQGYLKTVNQEALDAFLAGADLLILGAHAATDGRDDALNAPPDLTVVVATPETAPPCWQKEKEGVVLSPDTFVYPLS